MLTGFRHSNKWIYSTMLISACISLFAAFVLSKDAWLLAANPDTNLSCNLNSVVSCGKVGASWQAHLFGFPTSFLGLMFEPIVITVALCGLGGVKFRRHFMFVLQFIYLFAFCFAYWLFSQSILFIHALCPYCLLVTFSTTFVFFTLLHVNIRDNNLYLPPKLQSKMEYFISIGGDMLLEVICICTLAVIIFTTYGTAVFGH